MVLAAADAMVNADSGWAREHVTDNGNGTVSVLLFDKNGQEQWVTVTSDLPANAYGGQLGAKTGFGGNWPAYVEKALAQVYTEDDNNDGTKEGSPPDQAWPPGHYRAIEGNWGPDAFQYLAGPEVERTKDADVLQIHFQDTDPQFAQRGAQAFAEGYRTYTQQVATDRLMEQVYTLYEAL